ncbi:MAG: chemotaxis protein CheA [Pontixanthobacter sp.]
MEDLLAEFIAETREMLEAIEGELVAWENDPADHARLDAIFRFVHTVKGNCGFFNFPRLERLSHAAESALSDVRAHDRVADRALVDAILGVIDRIAAITNTIDAHGDMDGDLSDAETRNTQIDGPSDELLIAALNVDAVEGTEPSPTAADMGEGDQTSEASAPSSHYSAPAPRSIRLPVELLDRVMNSVSDMVLARNDLARRLRDGDDQAALDGPFERLTGILADMREDVTRMRMQRVEHLYAPLPRLVRDIAAELGKEVTFACEGGAVELDREMIEMIRDPITHLIRNAIGHGIETPAVREQVGKPAYGTLRIASRQSGNMISMILSDDGGGLDVPKIADRAVTAGLLTREQANETPDRQLAHLIFEPGLSTADKVSAMSGRGVGMDVVKANVEKIGGTISVASTRHKGTRFTLRLPLTLSIVSALTVSVDGQLFAIPHSYVEEIAHGRSSAVELAQIGDRDMLTYRGERLPCLTLNNVLDVKPRRAGRDQRLVVLRLGGGGLFALAVDRIHDQEDLVIKPLSPEVMTARIYAGTSLLDDGCPVPVLDISAIAERNGLSSESQSWTQHLPTEDAVPVAQSGLNLIVFDDFAGNRRAIAHSLVKRIDQVAPDAFQFSRNSAHCMIDGTLFPVGGDYRPGMRDDRIVVLRLSDKRSDLAYPIGVLHETISADGPLTATPADPELAGIALVGGKPVPVIDGAALFAQGSTGRETADGAPICLLPDDDWTQTMLKPLVEAAGYAVTTDATASSDVCFVLSTDVAAPLEKEGGAIIRLHDEPGRSDAPNDVIYRYDQAGILAALRRISPPSKKAVGS